MPEAIAMELAKKSYVEDLVNSFDLLHIDPTKDPYVVGKSIDMEVVLERTINLIEYVEMDESIAACRRLAMKWAQRKPTEG